MIPYLRRAPVPVRISNGESRPRGSRPGNRADRKTGALGSIILRQYYRVKLSADRSAAASELEPQPQLHLERIAGAVRTKILPLAVLQLLEHGRVLRP